MIKNMEQCELDAVLTVADKMVTAAKTAPKASGQDSIVAAVVTGEDKDRLAMAMREIGKREEKEFCIRDAGNVDNSVCVVLIGCKERPYGLNRCALCGFENCAAMKIHFFAFYPIFFPTRLENFYRNEWVQTHSIKLFLSF